MIPTRMLIPLIHGTGSATAMATRTVQRQLRIPPTNAMSAAIASRTPSGQVSATA